MFRSLIFQIIPQFNLESYFMSEEQITGKRGPQYDIDPNTLQEKSRNQTTQEGNIKTQPIPRKIFKIKGVIQQKSEPQKPKFTLFQKSEEGNKGKKQSQPQKEKSKTQTQSIFSKNLNENKNGVGLFSGLGSGFFGNTSENTGIFSSLNKNSGLFGKKEDSQSKKTFGSIFDFPSKGVPPESKTSLLFGNVNKQDEQDSGDQQQLANAQKLQTDKSKSTGQFIYQSNTTTIQSGLAKKFKKDSGDMIENVQVTIFQDEKKENYYFTAKLQATKVSIITGLLIKGKSKVRHINNKTENLEVIIFVIKKSTQENEKPIVQKHTIRLQFQNSEISKQLFEKIENIVKQQ